MVKIAIKNTSARRLNVVIPPGLVASSGAGQAGLGGGAAGGGALQNMGLWRLRNAPAASASSV